jgi:hypothetical protein
MDDSPTFPSQKALQPQNTMTTPTDSHSGLDSAVATKAASLVHPTEPADDTGKGQAEGDIEDRNGESHSIENGTELHPTAGVRRSSRRPAPTKPFDSGTQGLGTNAITPMTHGSRRNPKRKASEPAKQLGLLASDFLTEALRPLEPNDLEEWEGWVELESEPVCFSPLHSGCVPFSMLINISNRHSSL